MRGVVKWSIFALGVVALSASSGAATFTEVSGPGLGLPALQAAFGSWGDYDADGDMDLALGGELPNFRPSVAIYRNDGGLFRVALTNMSQVVEGGALWIDYDADGDIDLIVTGWSPATLSGTGELFLNQGNGTFNRAGLSFSSSRPVWAWADYDRDGDLDFILSSWLFEGYGPGLFWQYSTALPSLGRGAAAWFDYNEDNELDLIMTGLGNQGIKSGLFRRDEFNFTEVPSELPGCYESSLDLGDFDQDGDLDLLITGSTSLAGEGIAKVFRNDGGELKDSGIPLEGVYAGKGLWGDYNNDGWLDIALCGQAAASNRLLIYGFNPPTQSFTQQFALRGVRDGTLAWVDYDNDGDLDLFSSGNASAKTNPVARTAFFRNDGTTPILRPNAPTGLAAQTVSNSVILAWSKASGPTGSNSFTYNVRLQSNPTNFLVMPMSRSDGRRLVIENGNAGASLRHSITNLLPGTYTWSVQAIDHRFVGSPFSAVQSFRVNARPVITGTPPPGVPMNQGPVSFQFSVTDDATSPSALIVRISSYNTNLVTDENISYTRSGSNWVVTVRPIPDRAGFAFISVTVDDGEGGVTTGGASIYIINREPMITVSPQNRVDTYAFGEMFFDVTVSDPDSPAEQLTVWASHFDLPAGHTSVLGTGANRTLVVRSTTNWISSINIYVIVLDPQGAGDQALVNIQTTNGRPQISSIPDTIASYTQERFDVPFVIGDRETAASNLAVRIYSWATNVFPYTNLVLSGAGSNRVLSVTRPASKTGSGRIDLTVTDERGHSSSEIFNLSFSNALPLVSRPPDFLLPIGRSVPTIDFTVQDVETLAEDLTITLQSSNPGFISTNDLSLAGTGTNRQLHVRMPTNRLASATITIIVQDDLGGPAYAPFEIRVNEFEEFADLPGVAPASLDWVDFDADGWLDLFVAGVSNNQQVAQLYYNAAGAGFVDLGELFPQRAVASAWTDFDHDQFIDVLQVRAALASDYGAEIRSFNPGTARFESVMQLLAVQGAAAWADYDNDGDPDILLAGRNAESVHTRLLRNANSSFSDSGVSFPGLALPALAWADIDNDGDLDVAMTGSIDGTASGGRGFIYRNDRNGSFTLVEQSLSQFNAGSLDWGDFDGDGDPDLLAAGRFGPYSYGGITEIYRNDKGTNFPRHTSLTSIESGSASWGDFDNDGDLDILISGTNSLSPLTRILVNSNGTFTFSTSANRFPNVAGLSRWGDFDLDGDLDFAVAGITTDGSPALKVFRNLSGIPNHPPDTPSNLICTQAPNHATFRWDSGGDRNQWHPRSFNLRVGTTPGGSEILSANSLPNGSRLTPKMGNVGFNRTWTLTNLVFRQRYYWSVQQVDNSFVGSSFAPEQSFVAQYAPTISDIPFISRPIGQSFPLISFTVGDVETSPENLEVTATATDPAFQLQLGGSGTNRTLQIDVPPQYVSAYITVTVTDEDGGQASEQFYVSVFNFSPTIAIDTTTRTNVINTSVEVPFTIGDTETAVEELLVSATSGHRNLVPNANLVFAGAGRDRTLTITPLANRAGRTTITVRVRDTYGLSATKNFDVVFSQFSPASTNMIGDFSGPSAWGDYDNDGDLDLLIARKEDLNPNLRSTVLLRNEGGTAFVDSGIVLPPIFASVLAWADFDNDNDLDFVLGGRRAQSNTNVLQLYRNDGVGGFTLLNYLPLIFDPLASWADWDGDGDLDLLVSGRTNNNQYIGRQFLLRNQRTGFTLSTLMFRTNDSYSVDESGPAAWADYDRDGDQDLAVITRSYNLGLNFMTNHQAALKSDQSFPFDLYYSSPMLEWGDYDNDNDLDLLTARRASFDPAPALFRNNSNVFSFVSLSSVQLGMGKAVWADMDNDGKLDIAAAALNVVVPAVHVFFGSGAGSFTNLFSDPLGSIGATSMNVADYDNDGDLDMFVSGPVGSSSVEGSTRLYRNETTFPNALPAAPTNLLATTGSNQVTLSWSLAADPNQTNGHTFNLRIGTTAGGTEIMSPMADPVSGKRRVVQIGNASQSRSWHIRGLALGTYYWSAQAIDHTYAGSAFAPEQSFVIQNPPSISMVSTQVLLPGAITSELSFTVSDLETPAADLIVTAASSNTNVVANENITLGGAGNNRTVVVRASSRKGVATVTLTVTDAHNGKASSALVVRVQNNFPRISGLFDETVLVNTEVPDFPFTVSDVEFPADQIIVSARSSDTNIVPNANLFLGGFGSNRVLRVSPLPDVVGSTWITVSATDPLNETNLHTFRLRILATNIPPTIAQLPDAIRSINLNSTFALNVADLETSPFALQLSAASSDTNVVPSSGLSFVMQGINWSSLRVIPALNRSGITMISVTATDELGASTTMAFQLTITNRPPTFQNFFYSSYSISVGVLSSPIDLQVLDEEFAVNTLTITATSSNQTVLADSDISLPAQGATRPLRFRPSIPGRTEVRLVLRDPGGAETVKNITLFVYNEAPQIFSLSDVMAPVDQPARSITVRVNDRETPVDLLTLTAVSTNQALVPDESIIISGTGTNRTLTINPVPGQLGSTRIIAAVNDGHGTIVSNSFQYTVALFFPITNQFAPIVNGATAAGDYDRDGLIDIAVIGTGDAGPTNVLYRNAGNSVFQPLSVGLPNIQRGIVAWVDYDSDGDLDLFASGERTNTATLALLENTGGQFLPVATTLPAVFACAAAWADYDRDGWVDVLLSGQRDRFRSNDLTRIYRQISKGRFVDSGISLPALHESTAVWGDYDNDGDLDFAIAGKNIYDQARLVIYKNWSPGLFVPILLNAQFLTLTMLDWGDYDGDGDLDLVAGGISYSDNSTLLFRNDGADVFTDVFLGLKPAHSRGGGWADFDYDGFLDILCVGGSSAGPAVLRNQRDGTFAQLGPDLIYFDTSLGAIADYDNDGDLDFFLAGRNAFGRFAWLYQSRGFTRNTPPHTPSNLRSRVEGTSVLLLWDPAPDPNQPIPLTYNLRLGAVPGSSSLANPVSTPAHRGNNDLLSSRWLENLAPGHYFWTVQAIDDSFARSPFAQEMQFTIGQAAFTAIQVLPNGQIRLSLQGLPLRQYAIETSTDLQNWTRLSVLVTTSDSGATFTETPPPAQTRFYRALLVQ